MAVEVNSRSSIHKLLILLIKYIPPVIAFCYMVNTIVAYITDVTIEPLSNIAGMSLMTWIFTYVASWVFHFCIYHRLFLYYILVDDAINIADYYWIIPVSTDNILMIHNIFVGLLIFILVYIYVRGHKRTALKNSR